MKLYILGSSGWIPTKERETCCYMVEYEDTLIILDAGTGISRLKENLHILDKYNSIHIILSHYHLDHLIGMSYLPMWISDKELNIWAPSSKFYKKEPNEILETFTTFPFFSKSVKDFSSKVNIHEYNLDSFMLNNIKVRITQQEHTAPSFGITLGNKLHYATDTSVLKETFLQAQSVELLLHECWEYAPSKASHSSYQEIQKLHKKYCSNTRLGLIHLNPSWNSTDFAYLINNLSENTFICNDNMVLAL